ncbi:MAG: prohibitin family protein [Elusimicrobiota bacterium]|nr:prohibitin family protein [Elusimicrobiota bacterium]
MAPFLFLAVVVTGLIVFSKRAQWHDGRVVDPEALTRLLVRIGGGMLTLAILVGVLAGSVVIVPPGHRGVIFNRVSGIKQTALNEGLNFVIPVLEQAVLMDVRVQKDTYDATAASKDLQTVHTKVALNFRPIPESVPKLYSEVGWDYSDRVIAPAVQEAVKATTARFTAEELITHREDVKKIIQELVEKYVTKVNIRIEELYITDFDFSRQFSEAIESKQIAEQTALKAKRDLDRIKIEAEQKVATARAEAESLRMQREAITPGLIQLRQVETQKLAIEKWDGRMPSVMMGQGGATPLLNLQSLTPGK